ncbi:serine O-acetyltransferase EpsC [Streptomyces luteolus]|uniref:serine O-acetyltransferase n=1 Tax=Streptomyces luteolus TaxID=3043615 RepID=A0ABT6TA64_9ACTN|nr:serine O-acetyltransferase EpsC [Streptomyces sp. B-S-A12]MDI3423777.1 serine acetyltransferase [Streptomyces sp. B-S-A12]
MTIGIFRQLGEDLRVVVERDPSMRSRTEALWHPALPALWTHRLAHRLHRRGLRKSARILAYCARRATGVEIHPGAVLGRRVFIDHGAAVVIGETAVVGDDVTLYHQVTLGAVGWWNDVRRPEGERRHPVVGHHVVLGTNATVIGPVTVGDHAVVGAQALVTKDVPAGARVFAPTAVVQPVGSAARREDARPPHRTPQSVTTRNEDVCEPLCRRQHREPRRLNSLAPPTT